MNDELSASWDNAFELLQQWHEERPPDVGRVILSFIESELRLMTPALVLRSWPNDLVEDALRNVLVQLVENPLPNNITDLRAYLRRAFRNRCIDVYRVRKRETPLNDSAGEWEHPDQTGTSPLDAILLDEQRVRVRTALNRLTMTDRVVLKLELAPEWLVEEELAWLAQRTAQTPSAIRQSINAANDMHALTRIFDSGDDDPNELEARRKRMERFRRRRARAREKLRAQLEESGV